MNKKLSGSSMVEVMVASVIFLTMFLLSLETVVRITTGDPGDGLEAVAADYCADRALARYGDGRHQPGSYVDEHGWGTLTTHIAVYDLAPNILQVTVIARIRNTGKQIIRRHLVEEYTAGENLIETDDE